MRLGMQNRAELIYRSLLILLFVAFLVIFYRYSENGRYTYHKYLYNNGEDRYVVDTRTGTVYGHFTGDVGEGKKPFSYKSELLTNKEWYNSIEAKQDQGKKQLGQFSRPLEGDTK